MSWISELKINGQKDPIGITRLEEVSWKIQSEKRNVMQKAYELEIAKDNNFQEMLFQSGKVQNMKSVGVKNNLETVELCSAKKYFIRVKIMDEVNEWTEWEYGKFVTALVDKEEWRAMFLTPESEEDGRKSNGYYLRGEVNIEKKVKAAYAFSTALGLYHMYINGKKIGEDEFAPGWTSYNHRLLYQVYDVTQNLKTGQNVWAAHIGPGWYKGYMGSARTRNHYGTRLAFSGQIMVEYEDGETECIYTDMTWKAVKSPVIFSEIYDGEVYDARLEIEGWNYAKNDRSDWCDVKEIPFEKKYLKAQSGCKVKVMEKISANELFYTPEGDLVIDFGQNLSGWIEVRAIGKSGERIELNCFESLDKDGNVYTENLRTAKETIVYICKDSREVVYHPLFSFQGFRYAKISAWPSSSQKPDVRNFTASVIYSDMEQTGNFYCSDSRLNQLHHNILWGMKSNFLDVPTDCPQRDERLGWTGDAQIFCRTASYLMNTDMFFKKWLRDVASEQTKEGGIPHVVPDVWTGKNVTGKIFERGTDSAAGWADAAVIIPWTLYQMYGDTNVIKEQYECMKAWIRFMYDHAEDNVWKYKMQFGDWLALDAEEGSYYGATPLELTNMAYFAYSTGLLVKMAKIIGKGEDVEWLEKLYLEIKESYVRHFFTEDGRLIVQTQTAQILSLYFKLVPERWISLVVKDLLKLLKKENGHLSTGFLGTPYFCQVLSENGCVKEAYALLLKEDFPSWLYQVKQGATTVWEHWDGKKEDGSMWDPAMNSFNHYAYGAVGEWLYRGIAGIENKSAGFQSILISPCVDKGLAKVDASYESVYGKIVSKWEVNNDILSWNVKIPCNTRASLELKDVKILYDTDGLFFYREKKDNRYVWKTETGSGSYTIRGKID